MPALRTSSVQVHPAHCGFGLDLDGYQLVLLVFKVRLVLQVLVVLQVQQDLQVLQVQQVSRELVDSPVQLVSQVQQASRELVDLPVQQDLPEQPD